MQAIPWWVEAIPQWVYTPVMEFNITTNIDKYVKQVGPTTEKKFERAIKNALNDVVFMAKKDAGTRTQAVFDSPTPLTKNPALVDKAEKTPRGMEARVYLKGKWDMATKGSGPAEYLRAQITGGKRRDKRSERLLKIKGILAQGYQTVPTKAYRNRYGNITRGMIQKILSDLQAYSYSGTTEQNRPTFAYKKLKGRNNYRFRKADKNIKGGIARTQGRFYVIPAGKRGAGIYERKKKRPVMVMAFVPDPTYRKRYNFAWGVQKIVEGNFRRRFGYHFRRIHGM